MLAKGEDKNKDDPDDHKEPGEPEILAKTDDTDDYKRPPGEAD